MMPEHVVRATLAGSVEHTCYTQLHLVAAAAVGTATEQWVTHLCTPAPEQPAS
jgi:hypothetical protein